MKEPKYITPHAYSKKTGIPKDTVMRWALNGKIKDVKKITITRILINENYKHEKNKD